MKTADISTRATKEIALTAILSAAYAAAIMLVIIPSPTADYTQIGESAGFCLAHRASLSFEVLQ